jgi:hypothetical protein
MDVDLKAAQQSLAQMIAVRIATTAMHRPAAERIDRCMIVRKRDRPAQLIEDSVDPFANRNDIAVEIAEPVGGPANLRKKIRLEFDARLMVVERFRKVDLDNLVMLEPDVASRCESDDVMPGGSLEKADRGCGSLDMAGADYGEYKAGFDVCWHSILLKGAIPELLSGPGRATI